MDVTPAVSASVQMVQSYGPAGFRVAGVDYASSVLITALETWVVLKQQVDTLSIEDFSPLWAVQPPLEILLIGTGAKHELLPQTLKAALRDKGIGVDAMATGAAARTFNVLLTEERRVAALLLKV